MANITLSDYVNIYRSALGGKTIPANTTNSLIVLRNINPSSSFDMNSNHENLAATNGTSLVVQRNISPTVGADASGKERNYLSSVSATLAIPNINALLYQSAPVTKITSLNVGSSVVKSYPDTSKFIFSDTGNLRTVKTLFVPFLYGTSGISSTANFSDYNNQRNITSLLVPFLYGTTQINSDQVVVLPTISNSGVGIINITVVSGKYCSIILSANDGTGVSVIDSLPGSLVFDQPSNTISGIPFVVGTATAIATLFNGVKVNLEFNIIPSGLVNSI